MNGIDKLKQAIGVEEPMLIDVLKWSSRRAFSECWGYSENELWFSVSAIDNISGAWSSGYIIWNDSHYLKDQSEELINWLVSLI